MRRYLRYFFATTAIIIAFTACLSIIFKTYEHIEGDLTRIGGYAERDFGWNAAQPPVKIFGNGNSITNPDLLVLGDSFSRANVWQSVLSRRLNIRILSFDYHQAGCLDDWIEYALNQPTAKTIAINTLEMNFMKNETLRGKAINAPLRSHCAKFSNLRADRLLYYPVDEEKLHWKSEDQARAISHILSIQKRFEQRGKNFVLIVVPDKLSVYQDCLLNDADVESRKRVNILKSLIESGASTPDLLGDFKENANEIVDLYFPNNTHLSTRGYVLMAEKLDRFLTATTATNMKLAP